MGIIKTKEEFLDAKKNILADFETYLNSYNKFTRIVSPSSWRSLGNNFNSHNIKDSIKNAKGPITMKDLESEFIRDEVLTDEEKEIYNQITKYNL